MLANGPISFRVGRQGLTTQSTMEAELVAGVLAMKETIFFKGMMQELGFKDGFDSVHLFIDNTSAIHVAGNRTYSPRANTSPRDTSSSKSWSRTVRSPSTTRKRNTNLLALGQTISTSNVTGNLSTISGTLERERHRGPCARLRRLCRH